MSIIRSHMGIVQNVFRLARYAYSFLFKIEGYFLRAKRLFIRPSDVVFNTQDPWIYDRKRFLKFTHSCVISADWPFAVQPGSALSREHLWALITIDYHRLEKGLSLPDPVPTFGESSGVVLRLMRNVETYFGAFGKDDLISIAYSVLEEYAQFRQSHGVPLQDLESYLRQHQDEFQGSVYGGTCILKRDQVTPQHIDAQSFFSSRRSLRSFSSDPVSMDVVELAVRYALAGTPSICNRQPSKVYVISDPILKKATLNLQSGNKGFGHLAEKILLITSSLYCFEHEGERNEAWASGGMFAMSVMYALHALGIGCCPVNWDVLPAMDVGLRKVLSLPESDVVVMMLLVGHYPDRFKVTRSTRRSLNNVLHIL